MVMEGNDMVGKVARAVRGAAALAAALVLAVTVGAPAQAYEQRESIVAWGHGHNDAEYLVVHETANPGASARNHVTYWSSSPDYAVHYVMELDGSVVYRTVPDDRLCWHVGNANYRTVGIELAHATSQADFNAQWSEAVKWCGDYLASRGWGVDRMLSHNQCRQIWGGTDHTDPDGYFEAYGRSWDEFEAAVSAYLASGAVTEAPAAETPEQQATGIEDAGFGGSYVCQVDSMRIRTGAGLGHVPYDAVYGRGETVVLDGWHAVADGYVWGRYTSWGGNVCYVAVGRATGKVEDDDYLVKAGESAQGSPGAGVRTVTADVLNVRAEPWGEVVAQYRRGQTVFIEGAVESGGMEWGWYTAWSGKVRYVSMDWLA